MILNDLYSRESIETEFNKEKLYSLLLNNDFFEVKKQEILLQKDGNVTLRNGKVDYVYYISQGIAFTSIGEQIIDFCGQGEFVGLVDNSSVKGSDFYLNPLTELTVWRFKKSDVMTKVMSLQDGYLYYYNCMQERYQSYTNRIMLHEETDEKRTLIALHDIGEKFGRYNASLNMCVIPKAFTRKLVAAYLGISRTKLSDILSKLKKEGMISLNERRQIVIHKCMQTRKTFNRN